MTAPAPDTTTAAVSPSSAPATPIRVAAPGLRVAAGRKGRTKATSSTPARSTPSTQPSGPPASGSPTGSGPADPLGDDKPRSGIPSASEPAKIDKAQVREIFQALLFGVTKLAHDLLTRTEDEKRAGLWIADDDDQAAIADPLASIAERRSKEAGVVASPDAADLFTAAVGVVVYGLKNAMATVEFRRGRKKMQAALPDLVEHPGDRPTP